MKYLLTVFPLLAFCSSISAQNTYLSEDFTNGVPPAGWTSTAAPGTQGWVSTGSSAWHEDELNVTCDSYLISPDIDLSTATEAYLHFAGQTYLAELLANHPNSNGNGVGTIEVTTDGGVSWTAIWTDTSFTSGYTYEPNLEMTAFTGSANVKIRIHYFGTYAHEWLIDYLIIDDQPGLSLHQWDGQMGARFGCSVSTAGDIDGDGIPDILVGARNEKAVYIYSGADGSLIRKITPTPDKGNFGSIVSTAGDVDGDAVPDIIVGTGNYARSGSYGNGSVYVYSGANGSLIHQWSSPSSTSARFGCSVSTAGDVNGDAVPDIIVGASSDGVQNHGAAYVYSGADGSLIHQFDGRVSSGWLGSSVSTAGDIDSDGIPDILVGACFDFSTGWGGTAYVYSGANGSIIMVISTPLSSFPNSVATAGDIDGDGIPDILTAGGYLNAPNQQQSFAYSGASGFPIHSFLTSDSIAPAGDIDGDGIPDIILGIYDESHAWNGKVRVYSGANRWLIHQWDDQNGYSASTAGDVNGDGISDVLIGSPAVNNYSGSACVYSGLPVNRPPNARDDSVTTNQNIPVTIDVLANDDDPDLDTLTVISAGTPAHGNAIVVGDQIVYTPNAGWTGTEYFSYFIEDPDGATSSATITVYVNGPSYWISNFIAGHYAQFYISNAPPNSLITIGYSLAGAGPTNTPFGNVDMSPPIKSLVSLPADPSGAAWFTPLVPLGASGVTFYTQAKCGNMLSNSLALTVQ